MFKKFTKLLIIIGVALIFVTPAFAYRNGSITGETPWAVSPVPAGSLWISGNIPVYNTSYLKINDSNPAYTTTLKILETIISPNVARGGTVTVSYVMENTGTNNITGITASLRFFLGVTANPTNELASEYIVAPLFNPVALAPGTTGNYVFRVSIAGNATTGNVVVDGTSTGNVLGQLITDSIWLGLIPTWNTGAVTANVWNVIDGAAVTVTSVIVPPTRSISTTATFNVTVNIQNTGGVSANFIIPASTNLTFLQGGNISPQYIVIPPANLSGGGLVLGAGAADSLVYQVVFASNSPPPVTATGPVTIVASIPGTGDVVLNSFTAVGTGNVYVETAASLSVSAITIVSPQGAVDGVLSAGQQFVVSVNMQNYGEAGVTGASEVQLLVPAGYIISGAPTRSFMAGQDITWNVTATDNYLSLDVITVNISIIPLDINNLVTAGAAQGLVTRGITVERPAEINITSFTASTTNMTAGEVMSPPITLNIIVENIGSADATIAVNAADLEFLVSGNLDASYAAFITIPSASIFLPGNGATRNVVYLIGRVGLSIGAATCNVTLNALDMNSTIVTTDAALVTYNVTGNSIVAVGAIYTDRNPIGSLQTFQVFVPLLNSSTVITANIIPSSNDLWIARTISPGIDVAASFNVVPVSTAQFQLFPLQQRIITYNVTPLADAIESIYTFDARQNFPAATNNANGLTIGDPDGGIPTTNVIYDTTSPNVVAVTINITNAPAGPTSVTTNFIITIRFDESMAVSSVPLVSLQCAGLAPVIVGGAWSTGVSPNDTFIFNPGTLIAANEKWITVSIIGGGQDRALNNQNASPNIAVFYLDATLPTCSVVINGPVPPGQAVTINPRVTLNITGGDDYSPTTAMTMMISGDVSLNPGLLVNTYIPFQQEVTINLDSTPGTKSIILTVRDAAGNTSIVATDDIYIDIAGAYFVSPSINEAIAAIYNLKLNSTVFATTINYYYITPAGVTVSIYTDTSPSQPQPYNYNWDTRLLPVSMRNTANVSLYAEVWSNAHGTTYNAIVSGITIDNIIPTATVTAPANQYIDGLITFAGTATDNLSGVAQVQVELIRLNPFLITINAAAGTANWTYDFQVPSTDPHGTTYSIRVRARDRAGNWGLWSTAIPYFRDSSYPTVNITYPPQNSYVHNMVVITGNVQSLVGISLVEVSIGGLPFASAVGTLNWSYSYDFSIWPNSTQPGIVARASTVTTPNNKIGTSNTTLITIDSVSPNSIITSLVSGDAVAGTVNITGTASDGVGSGIDYIDFSFDGGNNWVSANGTTSWLYNGWAPNPASASFLLLTRARDLSLTNGNLATPSAITVFFNYSALPGVTINTPLTGTYVNNTTNITGIASGVGGIQWVQVDFDDGNGWVTVNGTSPWSYAWVVPAADAHGTTYSVRTQALTGKNILGEPSPSATVIYTKDIYPPSLTIINPTWGSVASGMVSINIAMTVSQAPVVSASVGVLIDNVFNAATYQSTSGNTTYWRYMWDASAAGGGAHSLVARAQDEAGNFGRSATVNIGSTGGFRTTVPIPAGSIINGTNLGIEIYATSLNVFYISGLNASNINLIVDGVPALVDWAGTNLIVTISAVEKDHIINIIETDPSTGASTANFQLVCYDVTPPTINAWFGGVNRLIKGSIIAPNYPFQLNVIDYIANQGSGFGSVPTYDVYAVSPSAGSMHLSLYEKNTTADSTSLNRVYSYSVTSEILDTTITTQTDGTFDLFIRVMDNAGNISQTFSVLGIKIQKGSDGTSGKIDLSKNILPYPNPWDPNEAEDIQFTFFLTDGVIKTNVYIYNELAELIHVIEQDQGEVGTHPGYNAISWNATDRDGMVLSNGIYLYAIYTRGNAGTSKITGKFIVLRR